MDQRPLTRISVFMNVFDVHVNRSPIDGEVVAHGLPSGQVRQRGARQGERAQRAPVDPPAGAGWPQHRGGADRRAGRAPHQVRPDVGPVAAGGRADRPDPVRQPGRCLPAGWRLAAGLRRAEARWRARRCWRTPRRTSRRGLARHGNLRHNEPAAAGSIVGGSRAMRRTRLRDHSINRLIPNMLTLFALCAGLTSIKFALDANTLMSLGRPVRGRGCGGTQVGAGRHRRHRRRGVRRAGRPDRAPARQHQQVRRGARFALRLHRVRRGAVGDPLCLDHGSDRPDRLGLLAAVQRLHGAAARALQHQARQHRRAGLDHALLHRRAGAGGRGPRAAAAHRLQRIRHRHRRLRRGWSAPG